MMLGAVSWRVRASGPVPPEEVWDRYVRPARWPEWSPQISAVQADGDRLVPGLRGAVRGPGGVRVPFVVVAVDEAARTWSWQVAAGPARLRLDHGVAAGRGGGSTTWLMISGPAPLVVLYAPMAKIAIRRLVRALADR
jgi:hypothetical protein